jgi:NO-binding membrane sensor protein with MHYT domain
MFKNVETQVDLGIEHIALCACNFSSFIIFELMDKVQKKARHSKYVQKKS